MDLLHFLPMRASASWARTNPVAGIAIAVPDRIARLINGLDRWLVAAAQLFLPLREKFAGL